jgi:glutathione synthase/RimK-type ligase-like ATP-grasp enzyme
MACAEKLVETLLDTDFFGRTVNPLGAGWCNGIRGIHYQFLRKFDLLVPDYVVTNDPDVARDFVSRHADVIVKSSGHHRTVVREVDEPRLKAINRVKVSPCVFQVNVRGPDVRVHVVDDRCFAVRIDSPETDYRYVKRRDLTFSRIDVPVIIADRCVDATQALGLQMAGIDFKIDIQGDWNCLEINPMPGYSGYDSVLDGAISSALVELLER